jgi:hypothetical protein
MSSFGLPPGSTPHATQYSRVDLQAAFNWLVNQPDHVRKQASDPDRLMTLYYRSSGRPNAETHSVRTDSVRLDTLRMESSTSRMESEAPVSSQNFLSDLRQINEALRQFESPQPAPVVAHAASHNSHVNGPIPTVAHSAHGSVHGPVSGSAPSPTQTAAPATPQAPLAPVALNARTLETLQEVREKLNLSSDLEALQMLISLGYKQLKPLIG